MSFGFARGVPRNADYVFDMRFLRNPYWVDDRCATSPGSTRRSRDHIAGDPAYEDALGRIEDLLLALLPRYRRGRKILCLDRVRLYRRAAPLGPRRRAGRSTVARGGIFAHVEHRDLASPPRDGIERSAGASSASTEADDASKVNE